MLKAGDVACLKSGGLEMTVEYITPDKRSACCVWSNPITKRIEKGQFSIEALAQIVRSTPPVWDGHPCNLSTDRGSLHFLFDEEGDLTVARWGWDDHGSLGWQTLGSEGEVTPAEMAASGWRYVGHLQSVTLSDAAKMRCGREAIAL